MQPLIYQVAATLDGFIAAPDGDLADFPADDDFVAHFLASLQGYAAMVMGRHTWEVGVRDGHTNPYPFLDIDKLLVSTTVDTSPDPAVRVTAEPIPEISRMKRQLNGPVWLCGGSQLAGHLLDAGLIDLIMVKHNPVLFGDGLPLFPRRRQTRHLTVVSSDYHERSGIRTVVYRIEA